MAVGANPGHNIGAFIMCIIIVQPAGDQPVAADTIRNAWDVNDDGAGFMYSAGGSVHVVKPFFRVDEFLEAYAEAHAAYGSDSAFVLHLRITTHGKSAENTHPHVIPFTDCAFAHNGILSDFIPTSSSVSDTVLFGESVLAYRTTEQLMSHEFGQYLGHLIGGGNKLAIMGPDGTVNIVNANQGIWEDGRWYSNSSYRKAVTLTYGRSSSNVRPITGDPVQNRLFEYADRCLPTGEERPVDADQYHYLISDRDYVDAIDIENAAYDYAMCGEEPPFEVDDMCEDARAIWNWAVAVAELDFASYMDRLGDHDGNPHSEWLKSED
jgi:hypothetical protein